MKLPETSELHVLWIKCCSGPVAVAHFTLVTASISHFLTAAIKFSCYFSNEIGLLCVFYLWLWLILCYPHANADIKIKLKERIGFVVVVFYLLKSEWLYDVPLKRTST